MKAYKKDLKEFLALTKKLTKEKDNSKMLIQFSEEEIKLQLLTQKVVVFNFIENIEFNGDLKSVIVDPFKFDTLLKGRLKELTFQVESGMLISEEGQIECKEVPYKELKKPEELTDFNDGELFIEILKEASDNLKVSEKDCTQYLKLQAVNALVAQQTKIDYYRISEQFEMDEIHIHMDLVNVLSKVLTKELSHGVKSIGDKKALIIGQENKLFFYLNTSVKIPFPNLKKMVHSTVKVASFEINSNDVYQKLSKYKKHVKEIEFKLNGPELLMIPRTEEDEPVEKFTIKNPSGEFNKSLFELNAIRNLFKSFEGENKVEIYEFKNMFSENAYLWRVTSKNKIIMIAGIDEPNWQEIQENKNKAQV